MSSPDRSDTDRGSLVVALQNVRAQLTDDDGRPLSGARYYTEALAMIEAALGEADHVDDELGERMRGMEDVTDLMRSSAFAYGVLKRLPAGFRIHGVQAVLVAACVEVEDLAAARAA